MADVTLAAQAVEDAPLAYPIPGAAELLLKLLTADYDGTGAGGPFVPCVQITLADGTVAGTFVLGQVVAAGSSVDVSWFPNGGVNDTLGLHWGVNVDVAELGLELDSASPNGFLANLTAVAGNGWTINVSGDDNQGLNENVSGTANAGINEAVTGDDSAGLSRSVTGANVTGIRDRISGTSNEGYLLDVDGDGGGPITLQIDGASNLGMKLRALAGSDGHGFGLIEQTTTTDPLAFLAGTPAPQQPTPVTLADVIAILQTFGLAA